MNDESHSCDERDQTLARFLEQIDASVDKDAVLTQFITAHPDLEIELRNACEAAQMLTAAQPEQTPQFLGEFEILREIGRGGMGVVYLANQRPLGRRVALKTMRAARVAAEDKRRFMREQEVLAKLHQTNVVPIFAAGIEQGVHYFAMQYVEGSSLHNLVRLAGSSASNMPGKNPPLHHLVRLVESADTEEPESSVPATDEHGSAPVGGRASSPRLPRLSREYCRSAAEIMIDVGEAMHFAHLQGILHRDLKPSNIMVDRRGRGWVIDFGLARVSNDCDGEAKLAEVKESFESAGMAGTPAYMAPEQLSDGKVTPRTDVWGLGACLYELLTFEPPTFDGSASSARGPTRRAKVVRPDSRTRNPPGDLQAICLKALSAQPEQRYESASQFVADLQRWRNFEPVRCRRASPLRRFVLWTRRNPAVGGVFLAMRHGASRHGLGGGPGCRA